MYLDTIVEFRKGKETMDATGMLEVSEQTFEIDEELSACS
jgi:hypothetical protein